jgi:hypothetical protein
MYDINEYVTIQSLHMRLLEEYTTEDFPYSHSSVYKWCKEIGFKWKTSSERKYLMEQPDIRLKRTKFLREYNKNKTLPSPLKPVFLDETWIFSKGAHRKSWQDETLATSSKKCGEGFRYIVVHAGFCAECSCGVRRVRKEISRKTPSWATSVLILYSGEIDRTGLKIFENNKNTG